MCVVLRPPDTLLPVFCVCGGVVRKSWSNVSYSLPLPRELSVSSFRPPSRLCLVSYSPLVSAEFAVAKKKKPVALLCCDCFGGSWNSKNPKSSVVFFSLTSLRLPKRGEGVCSLGCWIVFFTCDCWLQAVCVCGLYSERKEPRFNAFEGRIRASSSTTRRQRPRFFFTVPLPSSWTFSLSVQVRVQLFFLMSSSSSSVG